MTLARSFAAVFFLSHKATTLNFLPRLIKDVSVKTGAWVLLMFNPGFGKKTFAFRDTLHKFNGADRLVTPQLFFTYSSPPGVYFCYALYMETPIDQDHQGD